MNESGPQKKPIPIGLGAIFFLGLILAGFVVKSSTDKLRGSADKKRLAELRKWAKDPIGTWASTSVVNGHAAALGRKRVAMAIDFKADSATIYVAPVPPDANVGGARDELGPPGTLHWLKLYSGKVSRRADGTLQWQITDPETGHRGLFTAELLDYRLQVKITDWSSASDSSPQHFSAIFCKDISMPSSLLEIQIDNFSANDLWRGKIPEGTVPGD